MKKVIAAVALTGVFTGAAFAQWPAGTPESERGARPSPMGNPTPQEEVETRTDSQGRTVTEDGKPVKTLKGSEADVDESADDPSVEPGRHSSHGGPTDSASDPGEIE